MPESIVEREHGDPSRISAPTVDVTPQVSDRRLYRDVYVEVYSRLVTIPGVDGMSLADAHVRARQAADYAEQHVKGLL